MAKMLTEKGKIYKTCSKCFHTDAGLKLFSPLNDGPVNNFLPAIWPYINQALCQLVEVTCALLLNTVLKTSPNSANTRRWHVHDGEVRWISTGLGLWECARCHGHRWSWYSAVWIIFIVNYRVMLHEHFGQMALILVGVCESYW